MDAKSPAAENAQTASKSLSLASATIRSEVLAMFSREPSAGISVNGSSALMVMTAVSRLDGKAPRLGPLSPETLVWFHRCAAVWGSGSGPFLILRSQPENGKPSMRRDRNRNGQVDGRR